MWHLKEFDSLSPSMIYRKLFFTFLLGTFLIPNNTFGFTRFYENTGFPNGSIDGSGAFNQGALLINVSSTSGGWLDFLSFTLTTASAGENFGFRLNFGSTTLALSDVINIPASSVQGTSTWSGANRIFIEPNKVYSLYLATSTISPRGMYLCSTKGDGSGNPCTTRSITSSPGFDFTMSTNSSTANIAFLHPFSTSTKFNEFSDWSVEITESNTSTQNRFVVVDFSQSTTTLGRDKVNSSIYSGNVFGTFQKSFRKTVPLLFPPYSSDQIWYAQASIVHGTSTVAKSTILQFTITSSTSGIVNPTSTNPLANVNIGGIEVESGAFNVDCSAFTLGLFSSTTIPAIFCQVKKTTYEIVDFLFIPSIAATSDFFNKLSLFRDVFPFSPFFTVLDTIGDESENFVVDDSMSFNLPLTFSSSSITILSSSTISDHLGQSNKDLIFTFQEYLFWLFATGLVIKQFI